MLSSIKNAFTSLKEKAAETAAKTFLNQKLKGFGQVTTFEIDSRNKTMRLEVELKGEPAPVTVTAGSYSLTQESESTYIALHNLTASREWLTGLLNEYVAGRRFPIPNAAKVAFG